MAGLDPAILLGGQAKGARVKPGRDEMVTHLSTNPLICATLST